MNKRVLVLAIIAIFAIVVFVSCNIGAAQMAGTKWEATESDDEYFYRYTLEFKNTKEVTFTVAVTYHGETMSYSETGSFTATSSDAGSLTIDGDTANYKVSGNELTIYWEEEGLLYGQVFVKK